MLTHVGKLGRQQSRQAVCDEVSQLAASDLEQLQLLLPQRLDCKDSCSSCCQSALAGQTCVQQAVRQTHTTQAATLIRSVCRNAQTA